jgi:hypothetical protein
MVRFSTTMCDVEVLIPYRPITSVMIAKTASERTIATIPETTAEVTATPTAEALRPHRIPLRHPAIAIKMPKIELLHTPSQRSDGCTAVAAW